MRLKHRQNINIDLSSNAPNNTGAAKERGDGGVKGHAKANTEDLPDVIRSNTRNVSGTIAQSVSGKRETHAVTLTVFSCSPARLRPFLRRRTKSCALFPISEGGEKGVLSQIHVSFLSFLPFSSFPSTYRQFFVYPPRSVQCSFALRCFFNVKNIPLALLFFFLTSFPCRLAVLVFTLMQELTLVCLALSAPPLLTRPIVRGFVLSLTF